jgi:hypothetical protein
MAGDRVEDNLNPVGAAYSGFSTLLRTPNSLSQETKAAFGAQAGEERLREVAVQSGLTHVRRVAETPFNLVLEVRPKAKASARSSCRSRRRSAVGHGRGGHRSSGSGWLQITIFVTKLPTISGGSARALPDLIHHSA